MHRKNLDLIAAVCIAALNVIWALLRIHIPVIGIILALPLVFVLPGYTLTEVLFRKQPLVASHRLLLSLGLSLAIDILGGFILNISPVGLQATSWAILLGLLTAVFSLLAMYFRRGTILSNEARLPRFRFSIVLPMGLQATSLATLLGLLTAVFSLLAVYFRRGTILSNETRLPRFRFSTAGGILLALAITVSALSLRYAASGAEQKSHPGFTQLWILPVEQSGENCTVRLGVRSFESAPVKYRIVMTTNRAQVTTWSSVVLVPQQEWERVESITSGAAGSASVEVQLYRLDKSVNAYREVHFTFHKCGTSRALHPIRV